MIAIIGILVALLLPAIQAAREAARRSQCQNNLKQIGLAFMNHENSLKFFPSGGWGWQWTGDPDSNGERQPGGWAFAILPYVESSNVFVVGAGLTTAQKYAELAKQKAQPIDILYCPSRRPVRTYYGPDPTVNADHPPGDYVGKTDYAANGGSRSPGDGGTIGFSRGPDNRNCVDNYPQCNFGSFNDAKGIKDQFNGAVRPRFPLELRQFTDGTSKTILVGEKYLRSDLYGDVGSEFSVNACSDNGAAYLGYDWDVIRWANARLDPAFTRDYTPRPDSELLETCSVRFGSAHVGVFQVAMCDGSVEALGFDIDMGALELLASRRDGGELAGPPAAVKPRF